MENPSRWPQHVASGDTGHPRWRDFWKRRHGHGSADVEPESKTPAAAADDDVEARSRGNNESADRNEHPGSAPELALGRDRTTTKDGDGDHPQTPITRPAQENVPAKREEEETTSMSGSKSGRDWQSPNAKPNGVPDKPEDPDSELSALDRLRGRFEGSWSQLRTLLDAVRAPLPTQTGDGSALPKQQDQSVAHDIGEILKDIQKLGISKIEDLATVVEKAKMGQPLDDKKYYMEHLIQAAAKLPVDLVSTGITNTFLTTLWKDLEHPPQTLLSDVYRYRQPDGSCNNYKYPSIGAAGTPYARSVEPKTMRSGAMPDPGVLFDTVMARRDSAGTEHPSRISSMLFYLASIIIHDVFRTNRDDFNISDTSSYLDLAPLYGSSWAEQKRMRTFKDGKIKPDCFSESRLLTFPPGVGALLIMFNRYHNYVVEQLAAINEGGRFTEKPKKPNVDRYGESINRRDDDLFQTARLVTCGLYINIILVDYVRTILNLNRTDDNWQLNPRVDILDGPEVGTGNQVSAEFNLVYRWHSAVSPRDDRWTQELFKEIFPETSIEQVSSPSALPTFLGKLGAMEAQMNKAEPDERPFPALKAERMERVKEGPFKGNFEDDDLAAILTAGIEDCANAMGPQQVPTVMKAIEILGITQARSWHCATLNEFRKHFALEPHRTFESITANREVSEALKHLYDTPDNVELYPGLVVEDTKVPFMPGSGLCPSYTVSRGVLSDAVALVRGDRFYTSHYNPEVLTNWGFQEASSDLSIDNGCVFYKLFLRALPNNYDPASVYVHYPMTVPHGDNGMVEVLKSLGKAQKYNLDPPRPIAQPKVIFSYDAAKKVLADNETFQVTWGKAIEFLMGPEAKNFALAGDGPKNERSRKLMEGALYLGEPDGSRVIPKGQEKWLKAVREYYEEETTRLLKDKAYRLGKVGEVDIIRDVANMVHVHFAAELFSLPLKTEQFPLGVFSEKQLYMVLAAVFICVFFDVDPPKSFPLRQQAYEATRAVGEMMQFQVAFVKQTGGFAEWFINAVKPTAEPLRDYGVHMIRHLLKEDPDVANLVWGNIMGTMGGMVPNQGQLFGQAMDYFMTDGREHLPTINKLAKQDTPEADDRLMHYLLEACRLNGETGVFRQVTRETALVDDTAALGPKTYDLRPGDRVMLNLKAAGRDPAAFPSPDKFDPTRPLDSYILFGGGAHQCLGLPMLRVALTTMLKVIGRLDNLRPAPVAVGSVSTTSAVKKVVKEFVPGDSAVLPQGWHYHLFLTEDWDMYFPFPTCLKINWDGPIA